MTISFLRAALAAGFCVATLVGVACAAGAQDAAAEQRYIAARDTFIAKLKRDDKAGKLKDYPQKEEERVVADLETRLRAMIGPVEIKGMPGSGKLNNSTFFYSDVGFGMLDGLVFATSDEKTSVIVTTESLFARWLREHKNWWKQEPMPQDAAAALKTESFYTQAMSADAAVIRYIAVPVTKASGAGFVYAMLAARTQDESPSAPDETYVAAIQGGRVFVAWTKATNKVGPIAACDAARAGLLKKSDEAYEAYKASGLKNKKLFDTSSALREQAQDALRRCFAERAANEASFPAALKEAQALYDSLPAGR